MFRHLLTVTGLLVLQNLFAQCDSCIPDSSCTSPDGFPMMCPATPPEATVGEYYSEQITFFLPANVNDPASGISATLVEVDVTSIVGLPYGMEITFNNNDDTFLPSAGENYGCATICGTPIIPGTYAVLINADVALLVLGFEATQPQSFSTTITVLPGSGSANSFSFDNVAGCGQVAVNFSALIAAPAPDSTSYFWNFGNGQTSTDSLPSIVNYTEPGEYTAALTTSVSTLMLQQIILSGVNDNWSGDVDDLISTADPYFTISDASGIVFTSPTVDNSESASWNIESLTLSNPPYSIRFWDEDDISQDDDLGTATITSLPGTHLFDAGNGTTGVSIAAWQTTSSFSDSVNILVFALPDPLLTLDNDVATLAESNAQSIFWLQNNMPANLIGNPVMLEESGVYAAEITNEFGCTVISNNVLYCAPVYIAYDALAGELFVEDDFDTYQWYFNGLPIEGQNQAYHIMSASGNYAVEVTTDFGCAIESEVFSWINRVDEIDAPGIQIKPNPAQSQIQLTRLTNEPLHIIDATGRAVMQVTGTASSRMIHISQLPAGVYFVRQNNRTKRFIKL